jgi:1,4-alpha-glucan branching enzyme
VLRKAQTHRSELELLTLEEAVTLFPQPFEQSPSASSWGSSGYHEVWLNPKTQWIYPHQHQAEAAVVHMARHYSDAEGVLQRALNQASRELLLAESSDWAFLISQGTSAVYAIQRFRTHIARFWELRRQVEGNCIDLQALQDIESQDQLFSDLDFRAFG